MKVVDKKETANSILVMFWIPERLNFNFSKSKVGGED